MNRNIKGGKYAPQIGDTIYARRIRVEYNMDTFDTIKYAKGSIFKHKGPMFVWNYDGVIRIIGLAKTEKRMRIMAANPKYYRETTIHKFVRTKSLLTERCSELGIR